MKKILLIAALGMGVMFAQAQQEPKKSCCKAKKECADASKKDCKSAKSCCKGKSEASAAKKQETKAIAK